MTLHVNRAPVLTLWAAIVAERLGHSADTAMTLGRAVAGSAARMKARSIGREEQKYDRDADTPVLAVPHITAPAFLLGKEIRMLPNEDGEPRAAEGNRPSDSASVQRYLTKAFGVDFEPIRQAMEQLANRYTPQELNRIGFRLYEQFRPEVPPGNEGWGAKAVFDLNKVLFAR